MCSFPLEPIKLLPSAKSHVQLFEELYDLQSRDESVQKWLYFDTLIQTNFPLMKTDRLDSVFWTHSDFYLHTHKRARGITDTLSVCNIHISHLCVMACLPPSEKPHQPAPCRSRDGDQTGSVALAHWSWVSWGQVSPGWGPVCILWCPITPENTLTFPWAKRFPCLPPVHL